MQHSPDLAPSDFYLLDHSRNHLFRGIKFLQDANKDFCATGFS